MMARVRQMHRRELTSAKSCITAAATERFEKFRRYMADRDKREEILLLDSEAFVTLELMGTLEELGMRVPKKLKDTLAASEAKFMREMEEVIVIDITEQDLVLPRFPGLEPFRGLDQFGSNLEVVVPTAASALRSPAPDSEHLVTASDSSVADRLKPIASEDRVDKPLGSAHEASTQGTPIENQETTVAD